MRLFSRIRVVCRALWRRRNTEQELDLEMRDHFEQEVSDGMRRGLSEDEARLAAQRLMGPLELHKDGVRDALGITFGDNLARDVRFAVRTFRRTPTVAAIAVLTICLGIGANVTVFTFIENILLRGPAVKEPDRMATLAWGTGVDMSYPNYVDLRDRTTTFQALAGDRFEPVNMSFQRGNNSRVWGYEVTGNYFDVVGLQPQLGRFIGGDDDRQRGGHPVLVISDRLWRSRFAGDPAVVGRRVRLNGFPFTVIGVAPPGFNGTEMIVSADYWAPIAMVVQIEPGAHWTDVRVSQNLWAFGRLKSGVTYRQAEADLTRIVGQIARAYPSDVPPDTQIHLAKSGLVGKAVRDPVANFSLVLLTIAGTGLILACVNLAGILLARASVRQREIGIRLAIGANRRQLLRQLLTEAMVLAGAGGLLGIGLAIAACRFINSQQFEFGVPFSVKLTPDGTVLGFAVLLTFATALAFGLIPAWQTVRQPARPYLKTRPGRWTVRDFAVSAQVALSVVLVVCSLLVVKSLSQALALQLGLKPEAAFAMTTDLRSQGYSEARSVQFRRALLQRARAIPGVQAAGITNSLPLNLAGLEGDFYMPVGAPIPEPKSRAVALVYNVTEGYLQAAGTRLLAGRDISASDQKGRPLVALVNEAAARQLYPKESPLGRRFRLSLNPQDNGFEIVGIVETGKYRFLSDQNQPAVFVAIDQMNTSWTTLVVRSRLPASVISAQLRKEVLALDPELTLFQSGSLQEQLALALFPATVAAIALGTFGTLALVLAATGLFALVAFAVAKRRKEIGIRMALGASSSHVLQAVMLRTAIFSGIGIVTGLAVALAASRLLQAVLYGVDPHDPVTYASAIGLMAAVAVVAAWHPAARAVRVDASSVLRDE